MVKKAEDVEAVRDEIYRTLEQFKTKPVDAQKLDELKRRNRYAFLMELDTPDKVAGALARFVAVDRRHRGGRAVVTPRATRSRRKTSCMPRPSISCPSGAPSLC